MCPRNQELRGVWGMGLDYCPSELEVAVYYQHLAP